VTEPRRFNGKHHSTAVGQRTDLIGEQIRPKIAPYNSFRLPIFEQLCKFAAELRIASLDDCGER
jgi:hypothetical protein